MEVGEKIRIMRKKEKLTQEELGISIGLNVHSAEVRISQYEIGKRKPKIYYIHLLCQVFDIPICLLLENHDDPFINIYIELYWLMLKGNEAIYISQLFHVISIYDQKRYQEFIKLIKP